MKKATPEEIDRLEREFAAAAPSETAAIVRKIARCKRALMRGK